MQKKNTCLIIIIIILAILLLGLGGYLIYDKVLNNNDKANNTEVPDNSINNVKDIITNELYVLYDKNSIAEITNQEKLKVAIRKMWKETSDPITTITADELENYYKKTSIGNLPIIHESIYSDIDNIPAYEFDARTNTYSSNNVVGHGGNQIEPIYTRITDYNVDGDTYKIAVQFIFADVYFDEKIYATYNDAKNDTNEIANIPSYNGNDHLDNLKKYAEEHYDELKDKLYTYNYTFVYENDIFKLTDYSIEK